METLTSILVVLDRSARDVPLLGKSLVLALNFSARIELFSCDAEYEFTLRHMYDQRDLAAARQACVGKLRNYLQWLRDRLAALNVEVLIDAACESPLYEGIVRKVFRSAPDLVMKAGALEPFAGRGVLDPNDWQLARTCPVPLMLSCGDAWPVRPRFAAAVDVSDEETPGLAERILSTAEYLRAGCRGELEILFAERPDVAGPTRQAHAATLRRFGRELHVDTDRIRVLTGDPATTVPTFAARQRPDVLVLGALTHRGGVTALVGTLTRELMNTLDCDFILVRPSAFVSPVPNPYKSFAEAETYR
jgi:universal stress protein E